MPTTSQPASTGPDAIPRPAWHATAVCLILVLLVFAVFGQTVHFGFINFDDGDYVYDNPALSRSISAAAVGWAFTHVVSEHWHPLTVILLMIEHQMFGLRPGGYHVVNVLLHAAATVFLFLALIEMTGAFWRCAFVAAIFAIHPLRAESVAWVSECKDVLSAMFFMLALRSYARYARRPESKGDYLLLLLWFALGLLSKPMLVSLPCVLLLLDYWPLGRLRTYSQFPHLLLEKLPLFALSALSSYATVLALRLGSGSTPVSTYPGNIPIAYAACLVKLIYPRNLALLYPLPQEGWPAYQIFNASLLLAALTVGAWLLRRRIPQLLTGWLWYLVMLLPVAGLMQTGDEAYADRYTYLPQIGICIAVTWIAAEWAAKSGNRRVALAGFAALIIGLLAAACSRQTSYWHDSITLWTHTLACTRDNHIAYDNLGDALSKQGRTTEAIAQYQAALQINSGDAEAHNNLGNALLDQNRAGQAMREFDIALRIEPNDAEPHNNMGNALLKAGRIPEAIEEFQAALRINPASAEIHGNLGKALLDQGRTGDAIAEFRAALKIDPDNTRAHDNLAKALFQSGDTDEAIDECREALRVDPNDGLAHANLGDALLEQGRVDEAIIECLAAIRIDPNDAGAHNNLANAFMRRGRTAEAISQYSAALRIDSSLVVTRINLANALYEQGRLAEAIAQYRTVLQIEPANIDAENDLAMILATAAQKSLRDGPAALDLALNANRSTGGSNPLILRTLAAAYAENGDFPNALQTAQTALDLATNQSNAAAAQALRGEIKLYEAGRPVEDAH